MSTLLRLLLYYINKSIKHSNLICFPAFNQPTCFNLFRFNFYSSVLLLSYSIPVSWWYKVLRLHVVKHILGWSIWHALDYFNLSEHLLGLLPVAIDVVAESFLEDIEESLRELLSHLNQILVRFEQCRHLDRTRGENVLEVVSSHPCLHSSSLSLLLTHWGLEWLELQICGINVDGVKSECIIRFGRSQVINPSAH